MVLKPVNDHFILDRHFIEYEAQDPVSGRWLPFIAYARAIDLDCDTMTFIRSTGELTSYSPVRNVRIFAAIHNLRKRGQK